MYKKIEQCRLCGHHDLKVVVDLGEQFLTGIFPRDKDMQITRGPLTLAFCTECHLVQLFHSYNLDELYGENYGYRSGLNRSMVEHLRSKVNAILQFVSLDDDDVILDIGSNDGTTLSFYSEGRNLLVGFDPSEKFSHYYRKDTVLITDFFSAQRFREEIGRKKKAKIITSIASPCFMIWRIPFTSCVRSKAYWRMKGSGILNKVICPLCCKPMPMIRSAMSTLNTMPLNRSSG